MYNLNKYKSQYIGYNKIDTSRMAVHSINTSCHCSYRHTCATPVVHSHNYKPHTTLG